MIKTKKLRDLINGNKVVIAPCAYDALSARAIEFMGFELAATTGFGMHGTMLGVPDNGLLTFTEMVRMCRNMASSINIPMISSTLINLVPFIYGQFGGNSWSSMNKPAKPEFSNSLIVL